MKLKEICADGLHLYVLFRYWSLDWKSTKGMILMEMRMPPGLLVLRQSQLKLLCRFWLGWICWRFAEDFSENLQWITISIWVWKMYGMVTLFMRFYLVLYIQLYCRRWRKEMDTSLPFLAREYARQRVVMWQGKELIYSTSTSMHRRLEEWLWSQGGVCRWWRSGENE